MSKIRIVCAVLDTSILTLYKENGETIEIPQGDARVRRIVEEAAPLIMSQGWADVSLETDDVNHYAEFQKKSTGLVKLFKVAKEALKTLFTPMEPMTVGQPPEPSKPVTAHIQDAGIYDVSEEDEAMAAVEALQLKPVKDHTPKVQQTMSAIDEIMKHAVAVTSEDFSDTEVYQQGRIAETSGATSGKPTDLSKDQSKDTIIAVVGGKIVPGVEIIKSQFKHASMGSTIGMERFLARIAAVIEDRSHSVEDLLKFMERGDLPIADDGSILIYKVLNKSGNRNDDKHTQQYVDCHSKRVQQWVGAYVCMDPSLVDKNRRNECSNGLHVARRGYIGNFSGDVCVLAKLAPEDVIAVPDYDANKMRVCGYHIIMELPNEMYQKLRSNKVITDTEEGQQLLAKAIRGDHIGKTHEVKIHAQMGQNVKVSRIKQEDKPVDPITEDTDEVVAESVTVTSNVPAVDKVHAISDAGIEAPLDVREVAKAVSGMSRKDQAKALYDDWLAQDNFPTARHEAFDKLVAYKKACKCSWESLGITNSLFTGESKVTTKSKAKGKSKVKPKAKHTDKVKPSNTVFKPATPVSEGSPKDRIAKLLSLGLNPDIAKRVYDIKKASKKSWETLGVVKSTEEAIMIYLIK